MFPAETKTATDHNLNVSARDMVKCLCVSLALSFSLFLLLFCLQVLTQFSLLTDAEVSPP